MKNGQDQARNSVDCTRNCELSLAKVTDSIMEICDMSIATASSIEELSLVANNIQKSIVEIKIAGSSTVERSEKVKKFSTNMKIMSTKLDEIISFFK